MPIPLIIPIISLAITAVGTGLSIKAQADKNRISKDTAAASLSQEGQAARLEALNNEADEIAARDKIRADSEAFEAATNRRRQTARTITIAGLVLSGVGLVGLIIFMALRRN